MAILVAYTVQLPMLSPIPTTEFSSIHTSNCNCVIFRYDDAADYFSESQIATLDVFLQKNQSVDIGIVVDSIGSNQLVVSKIKEGLDRGLFELGIHGWSHVDYTTLTEEEQKTTMQLANDKMQSLFGRNTNIFMAPYQQFNNDTLSAMKKLGLKIISSGTEEDPYRYYPLRDQYGIMHLPSTFYFPDKTLDQLINNIDESLQQYGFAVVAIHPQEFRINDDANVPDPVKLNLLDSFIDTILARGLQITTFGNLAAVSVPPDQEPTTCTTGWKVTGYFAPLEGDYEDDTSIAVTLQDGSSKQFKKTFVDKINVEGVGLTLDGSYLAHFGRDPYYYYFKQSEGEATASGMPLEIGIVAVTLGGKDMEKGTMPFGTRINVPTAAEPWNRMEYVAGDTGGWRDKHIDVFTGVGRTAEKETLRVTHDNATVCSN